jgi:hypothetical protein
MKVLMCTVEEVDALVLDSGLALNHNLTSRHHIVGITLLRDREAVYGVL